MTYDRAEVTHIANRKRIDAAPARRNLEIIAQAAVNTNLLLGHPLWDRFLTYIQAAIETTQTQLAEWQAKLSSSTLVNYEDLIRIKIAVAECTARIDAWKAIIHLPKELQKSGGQAKDLLAAMDAQRIEDNDRSNVD